MTRTLLFFALAGIGSAQSSPAVAAQIRGDLSGNLPTRTGHPSGWNRLRPGQSAAAIGLESGGDPAQQGAPAERVEASQHFAGGVGPDGGARQYRAGSTPARLHQHQHKCNDFGGGIMGPASERTAGLPTRKVRPATASAPYWRGQYRCTMRTRIDDKGREWQGEECLWFFFGGVPTVDRESPTGPVATLHTPQPGRRSDGGVADGRSTPINRRLPADYDWVGARPGMVTASPMPTLQHAGWWKRHLADTALHLGATSADAASSWGRVELNPVLRSSDGRFGARGLGIKLGIFAGVELVKWRLSKRYPRERWVRALSLGPAAAFGGVAVRNWSVR